MPPRIPLRSFTVFRSPIASSRCILGLRVSQSCQFGSTCPLYESELPSAKEERRSSLSKNLSNRLDHMQAAIFMAGQKINDLTGYSGIEVLKRDINEQEAKLVAAKAAVQEAKSAYKAAIARRSDSQKEVNELLQRKNTWTPVDLERFTELYRSDHANEQAEIQAQNHLTDVEKEVDSVNSLLSKSILTRYHEEQVWSDKIRRASTWGTWMLMGINIALFVVVQLGLEPWKRRRLVNNFEEKVKIMLQEEKALILMAQEARSSKPEAVVPESVPLSDAKAATPLVVDTEVPESSITLRDEPIAPTDAEPMTTAVAQETPAPIANSEISKPLTEIAVERISALFSSDTVAIRQVDITKYVIEGFAAGAIVAMVGLGAVLRPR